MAFAIAVLAIANVILFILNAKVSSDVRELKRRLKWYSNV